MSGEWILGLEPGQMRHVEPALRRARAHARFVWTVAPSSGINDHELAARCRLREEHLTTWLEDFHLHGLRGAAGRTEVGANREHLGLLFDDRRTDFRKARRQRS